MIYLERTQLRTLRGMLRAAFNHTTRLRMPDITFVPTETGLAVRSSDGRVAVELRLESESKGPAVTISPTALVAADKCRSDWVALQLNGQQVTVRWMDGAIPQESTFGNGAEATWPTLPAEMVTNDTSFLANFRDAAETTDSTSSRFSLGCLRLRGDDGQIAATDGRQAFTAAGFHFPWQEAVLIPGSRFFSHEAALATSTVSIGKTEDWVAIQGDHWTVWFNIEKEARFPRVDDSFPSTVGTSATLYLADADAAFLADAVNRLPGTNDPFSPVTVDMNGEVVVRAAAADQPITELVLNRSSRGGNEIRFATNRCFLARAARLGFREIALHDAKTPACCRDDRRAYCWMVLDASVVVAPGTDPTRIDSAAYAPSSHRRHKRRTRLSNATPKTTPRKTAAQPRPSDPSTDAKSPLELAEGLSGLLRQTLTQVRNLKVALRKQKKQNQIAKDALNSLRQLQDVA